MSRPYCDTEVAKQWPPNQRNSIGVRLCSFCQKELKGRQLRWCSEICQNEFWRRTQWSGARAWVVKRDAGVCQKCGADTLVRQEAYRWYERWWIKSRAPQPFRYRSLYQGSVDHSDHPYFLARILDLAPGEAPGEHDPFEVDHITPLSEGGKLCDDSNLRVLCRTCHKIETALLRARLAKTKRIQRKHAAVRNRSLF